MVSSTVSEDPKMIILGLSLEGKRKVYFVGNIREIKFSVKISQRRSVYLNFHPRSIAYANSENIPG